MKRYPIYVRVEPMPPVVKVVGFFVAIYLLSRGIGSILADALMYYAVDIIETIDNFNF